MERETDLYAIPKGWMWARLEDVCFVQGGYAFRSSEYQDEGVPLLRISNIIGNKVIFEKDMVFLPEQYQNEYAGFLLTNGEIVIALSGATTGKFGVYDLERPALLNQRVGRLKYYNHDLVVNRYFLYYMHVVRKQILNKAYGAAQPNIGTTELAQLKIPFAPLQEQRRIVAKIEELFTQLDDGVAELKKVQHQLKSYRQSVLKSAFDGSLTAKWREEHKAELEPASMLLEKIETERKKNSKYQELPSQDTAGLPELPEGWGWASLAELSWDSSYGTSEKCTYESNGYPVLRIPNIVGNRIDLADLKYSVNNFKIGDNEELKYADLLIVRTNGSRDLIGRTALVSQNFTKPHLFASYLIRFRLRNTGSIPMWVNYTFLSQRVRDWVEQKAATSAGQYNISMSVLSKLNIAVPSLQEQKIIIAEIDRCFSATDEIEEIIERSLKQAERLRQSILKKAFEGKLVSQDPEDEPAGKLLERIKAEKIKIKMNSKRGRTVNVR